MILSVVDSATQQGQAGVFRRLWQRFRDSRVATTFAKFFAGSSVGLVISQIVVLGMFGYTDVSAWLVNLIAFVAGAIPNFLLNRRWAWGRTSTEGMWKEVLPYAAVVGTGGLISAGIGSLGQHFVDPLHLGNLLHAVVMDGVYLFSLCFTFVFKFVLLDRFVFRSAPNGYAAAESADEEPAAAK